MLHAWEKYGLDMAEKEFFSKYDHKHRRTSSPHGTFKQIVRGKLNFLKAVRGGSNPQYIKLCKKLAEVDPEFVGAYRKIHMFMEENILDNSIIILESAENQGTGFLLEGVGLVTCDHVLRKGLYAFKWTSPQNHYQVRVIKRNDRLDIAVLEIERMEEFSHLPRGTSSKIKHGDPIKIAGFPHYGYGQTIQIYPGVVVGERRFFEKKRFTVSTSIYEGNSGGPVLNDHKQVVGIAVRGDDKSGSKTSIQNEIIPIDFLDDLLTENGELNN